MERKWLIFWHSVFWISMIAFFIFITRSNSYMPPEKLIIIFVVYGLLNILLFYINFLFIIPRFLHAKKYWQYVLAAFSLVVILGLTKYFIALYFHDYILLR